MPHVAFISFSGYRINADPFKSLEIALPGLYQRTKHLNNLPALGLLTLAGMTPDPWTCSYHESNIYTNSKLLEEVLSRDPVLIAISSLTASIEETYQFCTSLSAYPPKVVMGGLHVTACPEEAINYCDAVVIGEGETVWSQILEDAQSNSLRKFYRSDKYFDLANSPLPRWDLLVGHFRHRYLLQTERGCPLACSFCGSSRMLGPMREKPIERITQELEQLSNITPDLVLELADDNSLSGSRDAVKWLDTLSSFSIRYVTEMDWRVGERQEVVERLAESGCLMVLVGMESRTHKFSGMGDKHAIPYSRVMRAIESIQNSGVVVMGCFIAGADGETQASLNDLESWILDSDLGDVQVTLPTPFPGTPLYQQMKKEGRLILDRGWSYYNLFDLVFHPNPMRAEELEEGFQGLLKSVFSKDASKKRNEIKQSIWRSHPKTRK